MLIFQNEITNLTYEFSKQKLSVRHFYLHLACVGGECILPSAALVFLVQLKLNFSKLNRTLKHHTTLVDSLLPMRCNLGFVIRFCV